MDVRDRARSDVYLAQLRSQSTPNTPGFGPMSPSSSTPVERRIEHVSAAPSEQTYDAVPIPGACASPLSSPGLAQLQHQ
ncbi:hypothetical protein ACEPPN_019156 [Leptodophora sp. 'Broadleaf-Isolate-01']